jgi:hypothetical protein
MSRRSVLPVIMCLCAVSLLAQDLKNIQVGASTGLRELTPPGVSGGIPPGASPTTPSAERLPDSGKFTLTWVSTLTGSPSER